MKVVAVANQKGGVGKTTSVVNIACRLASYGVRVLMVDMDPQANATSCFSSLVREKEAQKDLNLSAGVYEVITGSADCISTMVSINKNLSYLAARGDLAAAELELVSMLDRESQLKYGLESLRGKVDYVIIDTPPTLGLLTVNALTASDSVLVPLQTEYYALEGLSQLLKTIEVIKRRLNPELCLEGIFLTMFDRRNNLSRQVEENVRSHFGDLVYRTLVPRNVRLSEAPSHGESIFHYAPKSSGAGAYSQLVEEFLELQQEIVPSEEGGVYV